jgi:hypothetical protein
LRGWGFKGVVERFVYILFGEFWLGDFGEETGFYSEKWVLEIFYCPLWPKKSRNSRKLGFIPKSGF